MFKKSGNGKPEKASTIPGNCDLIIIFANLFFVVTSKHLEVVLVPFGWVFKINQ